MKKDIVDMSPEELGNYKQKLLKELFKISAIQKKRYFDDRKIYEGEKRYLVTMPFRGCISMDVYAQNEEIAKLNAYGDACIDFIEDEDISDIEFAWYEDEDYEVLDFVEEFGETEK